MHGDDAVARGVLRHVQFECCGRWFVVRAAAAKGLIILFRKLRLRCSAIAEVMRILAVLVEKRGQRGGEGGAPTREGWGGSHGQKRGPAATPPHFRGPRRP